MIFHRGVLAAGITAVWNIIKHEQQHNSCAENSDIWLTSGLKCHVRRESRGKMHVKRQSYADNSADHTVFQPGNEHWAQTGPWNCPKCCVLMTTLGRFWSPNGSETLNQANWGVWGKAPAASKSTEATETSSDKYLFSASSFSRLTSCPFKETKITDIHMILRSAPESCQVWSSTASRKPLLRL